MRFDVGNCCLSWTRLDLGDVGVAASMCAPRQLQPRLDDLLLMVLLPTERKEKRERRKKGREKKERKEWKKGKKG